MALPSPDLDFTQYILASALLTVKHPPYAQISENSDEIVGEPISRPLSGFD